MRTVAELRRRQLRRWTKCCSEAYETEQPLADSNSWMRVNRNRFPVQGLLIVERGVWVVR